MAKSKYKDVYCNYCKKVTRMAILKEPEDNKGWFTCSRCHHSFNIDLGSPEFEKKEEKPLPSKEECLTYNPTQEYSVGDPIYHSEWDDIGKIEAKKKLSNGNSAIVVRFQKEGVKYLIEKLQIIEEPEEIPLLEPVPQVVEEVLSEENPEPVVSAEQEPVIEETPKVETEEASEIRNEQEINQNFINNN